MKYPVEEKIMDHNVYYQPPIPGKDTTPSASHTPPAAGVNTPPPYLPQPVTVKKKEYQPLTKKDSVFVFVFLACAFLFVDFALFHAFSLGFTVSYFILFGATTAYLWDKTKRPDAFSLCCGALSLTGAVTFALYSNYFINTMMVFLMAGLFTLYCLGISHCYAHSRSNYKVLIDVFAGAVLEPLESLGDILGSMKASADKSKRNMSALIGILLAIPVLAVIIPLLISSDAAFEKLIGVIAKNIGKYLLELAIAIVLTPFLFSFMFGKRNRLHVDSRKKIAPLKKRVPISGSVSFLSMISLTYLVYLFSQLAYFFSAFSGLLPKGYTRGASAFARRGFYEMFAVCAINVILISVISMVTKRRKGKVSAGIKWLSLFISLFSVLMIITAIQKMVLNITTYGFTRNRLLVFVCMLMVLVAILFFIVHIFLPKAGYMQPVILICSVMFIALSFMNVDAFTYEQNYKAYQSGNLKTLDMYTVSTLTNSDRYFADLASKKDEKLSHKARLMLIRDYFTDDFSKYTVNKGEISVRKKEKDLRSYCRDNEETQQRVIAYYNSLSPEERAHFDREVKLMQDGSYDPDADVVYYYDSNTGDQTMKYNPATDTYDIPVTENV